MPRPKLIQFGDPEPPHKEEPKSQPPSDVFNEKPTGVAKSGKKAQKFKPPQKDLSVNAPVPEPEPEPEPEPIEYEEPETPEPQYVTEPVKKTKKPISDKQRAHLERMRQKRAENRAKQKPTAYKNTSASQFQPPQPADEDAEFSNWLKNYEKFDKVLSAREEKEKKKREEEERKEREIEERIRKKIEEENRQALGQHRQSKPIQTSNVPMLQQQQESRFGQYSNFFGY